MLGRKNLELGPDIKAAHAALFLFDMIDSDIDEHIWGEKQVIAWVSCPGKELVDDPVNSP